MFRQRSAGMFLAQSWPAERTTTVTMVLRGGRLTPLQRIRWDLRLSLCTALNKFIGATGNRTWGQRVQQEIIHATSGREATLTQVFAAFMRGVPRMP